MLAVTASSQAQLESNPLSFERPLSNLRSQLQPPKNPRFFKWVGVVLGLVLLTIGSVKMGIPGLLVNNHRSWIEDIYLALLVVTSLYVVYMQATIKRKSKTNNAWAHVISGAGLVVVSLYAIALERIWRVSPGWIWCWATFSFYMINCLTVGPLMKYLRAPKHITMMFKLGFDFVISFQGIHLIAWSHQLPILYWAVMPFWYFSIQKFRVSADYMLALLPNNTNSESLESGSTSLFCRWQASATERLKGIELDTPTIMYVVLNLAAALFDNAYMAWYTYKGPQEFWAFVDAFCPAALQLSLIKPAVGSLTISLVVFLGTLVQRRALSMRVGMWLNVALASVGPWVVLFWHKLLVFNEPWFPEFMSLIK